ncbi:peptidase, partial [candidate division KSB1 bacterium]|nr:peptidase [candidate division KSB1 bacterium]
MPSPLVYEVNLNDRAEDTFKVTLFVHDLKPENAVYQFAASAPGTYQTMDMGRFVRSFKAFSQDGSEIKTEQITTNQWKIAHPEKVAEIRYAIAETWDTPVDSNSIYVMCGSSFEDDHALLNGQTVFGYPTGMQDRALKIKVDYPEKWVIGTALNQDSQGYYMADDYDHIVDSPILVGKLTQASVDVQGSKVEIYVYSQNDSINASEILDSTKEILTAAAQFTKGLPVDRYAFLFHFENKEVFSGGAWEHSYSSIYSFGEASIKTMLSRDLVGTMAHEFFHIITPLHIHSELIEHFNFVKPQPSEHLWLYEGTTEWASNIMQLRGGLISLDDYLKIERGKLRTNDHFRKDYSLSQLAMDSFSKAGRSQYFNIYQRGAVVAGLLDLRLLELSEGKRGLREVLLALSERFGPDKPFSEKEFFNTFTQMTSPEIADFFNRYVKNSEKLPVHDYFANIGITYTDELHTGKIDTTAGLKLTMRDEKIVFDDLPEQTLAMGLENGDEITAVNGQEFTMKTFRSLFREITALGLDESYTITVLRNGEEKTVTLKKFTQEKIERHVFEVDENPSPKQLALRQAW